MKRLLTVACIAVLFTGCKSKTPAHEAAPAAPEEARVEEKAEEARPAEPVAEEKKIEIDEALVEKYVGFEKELLELMRTSVEEAKKKITPTGKEPTTAEAFKNVAAVGDFTKKIEEGRAALLKKAGLSEEEEKALREVVTSVATARMLLKNAGPGLENMEKQMKAQIAALPKEKQAEAEAEMNQMTQSLKDMRECKDAREQFGDKAVEAVLEHEAELISLQEQLLKVGFGK